MNDKFVGARSYECPRYGCVKAWNDDWGKHRTTNDLHLSWDVVYEPGELRAEGYKNGEKVAETRVVTTGEATGLKAETDNREIKVGGIAQIELSTVDSEGRDVITADPMIECRIEGPAVLVGMDAGDLTDLSLYSNIKRRMFHGKLLAVIYAEEPGEVKVTLSTDEGLSVTETVVIKD